MVGLAKWRVLVVVLVALSSFVGCSRATKPVKAPGRVVVEQEFNLLTAVNSLVAPDAGAKRRYMLLPSRSDDPQNELQYNEFAVYVEKILLSLSFHKAKSLAEADVVIFLSYGVGDQKTRQYTYRLPVWGQTGISTSQTFGTISGTGWFSGTTTYTPSYGITGYTTEIENVTTFTCFLLLDAYDVAIYKRQKILSQLWRTDVVSVGENSDLRVVFPYLAVAMKDFIATDTRKRISAWTTRSDVAKLLPESVIPISSQYERPFSKGRDY